MIDIEIIKIGASVIAGGGLVKFLDFLLKYKNTSRSDGRDDFKLISDTFQKLLDKSIHAEHKCEEELKELRAEVLELNSRIKQTETQIILLESAQDTLPFPMWLKDMQFKMLYLNKEYEKKFLTPMGKNATDYIGKYDEDVWGEEQGDVYRKHDMMAVMNRKVWSGVEPGVDGEKLRVVKWIRYAGEHPIGIAGLAIPVIIKSS